MTSLNLIWPGKPADQYIVHNNIFNDPADLRYSQEITATQHLVTSRQYLCTFGGQEDQVARLCTEC